MTAVWVVRAGDENVLAPEVRSKSAVAIGWAQVGPLHPGTDRPAMLALVRQAFPNEKAVWQTVSSGQLYRFLNEIAVDNFILTPIKATRTILVGKILSDYEYDTDMFGPDYPHVRRVNWIGELSRDDLSEPIRNTLGALLTVFRADAHVDEIRSLLEGSNNRELDQGLEIVPFHDDVKSRADELIRDLLAKVPPYDFQSVVAAVLRALGYVAKVSPRGRDGGVDILAHPDSLGFANPVIKVQVKHRTGASGRPDVQGLAGTLHPNEFGLFVSTGGFTREARDWASQSGSRITLVDGDDFVQLLLENYVSLDPETKASCR